MWVMVCILILGSIKMLLFGLVLVILLIALALKHIKFLRQKEVTQGVIRSLASFKYHALMTRESEEECSICCNEYKEDDVVTRLDCS